MFKNSFYTKNFIVHHHRDPKLIKKGLPTKTNKKIIFEGNRIRYLRHREYYTLMTKETNQKRRIRLKIKNWTKGSLTGHRDIELTINY